jgi:Fe-S-cluster containining protein
MYVKECNVKGVGIHVVRMEREEAGTELEKILNETLQRSYGSRYFSDSGDREIWCDFIMRLARLRASRRK